ncbi:MAG: TRAP transporter small permease [Lawsonibacter sp.]|nr:TRAP transporter small permease [Lawsonibacter sp.]
MATIRKLYDGLFKIVEFASAIFLAGMVVICFYSVVMRYVFHAAPRWGDEMALFCMIWYGLLSASLALKENRHIRIGIWDSLLPQKASRVLLIIVHLIVLVVVIILLRYSALLTHLAGRTRMTGSGYPLSLEYAALPVSAVFMLIATIGRLGEIIGRKC